LTYEICTYPETKGRLREPAKLLSLTSKARQAGRKQKRRQGTSTTCQILDSHPTERTQPPNSTAVLLLAHRRRAELLRAYAEAHLPLRCPPPQQQSAPLARAVRVRSASVRAAPRCRSRCQATAGPTSVAASASPRQRE